MRQNWDALHNDIVSLFESSQIALDEAFADRRTYSVSQSAVASLGDVFASLRNCKLHFCS